jgi:hypothetical protein
MKRVYSLMGGEDGISLVELLVTMALVIIVVTMNTDTLGVIMKQSRQQTQAVSAAMDRIMGFEILRMDAELAGFGLPWSFQGSAGYNEAADSPQSSYNDSPSGPPRAIMTGNNTGINGSDYLVIKSTAVGAGDTAQKWSYIVYGSATARKWGSVRDLASGERVIVLWPNASGGLDKQLVMDGTTLYTTVSDSNGTIPAKFRPLTASASYLIYGVDAAVNPRMPFNRADYYIARPDPMPGGCAPGTGVLYKSVVSHSDGKMGTTTPLLDCVADMQVVFQLDTDLDGVIDTQSNNISSLSAQGIRQQVKEVRIYILSHEGEQDKMFSYMNPENPLSSTVTVGEFGLGSTMDLSATVGSGWRNYRWKASTLVIRAKNILG